MTIRHLDPQGQPLMWKPTTLMFRSPPGFSMIRELGFRELGTWEVASEPNPLGASDWVSGRRQRIKGHLRSSWAHTINPYSIQFLRLRA